MKNLMNSISNRTKGLYLLWTVSNCFLWLLSYIKSPFLNHVEGLEKVLIIYPSGGWAKGYIIPIFTLTAYDYTEILLYVILPIFLIIGFKLIFSDKNSSKDN